MQHRARSFSLAPVAVAVAAGAPAGAPAAGCDGRDAGGAALGGGGGVGGGAGSDGGAGLVDAGGDGGTTSPDLLPPPDTLDGNRDRLLASYLAFLQLTPTTPQSNGLAGGQLADTCALWHALDPSSQAVFLTLTARMQGSRRPDGSSMLAHVAKLYRLTGGQGATATDAGSCGGGEYNRMMMSMDAALHDTLVAANGDKGQPNAAGVVDLADVPMGGTFWRDSHDLGGPHAPFDLSDETDTGAPRGQVQYFRDPTSAAAQSSLGRLDLTTLVDPYALEMDQDYDCTHNSNPSCDYVTYGPLCAPEASTRGLDLYVKSYGDVEPAWQPSSCHNP